ncbi:hypothetical protein AWC01_14780 [Mycobacterium doricum]|uniref:Uncharacterized protein n=1 Tax=Mycolicibacterium doricum TaxID=126673 RepID=A0A1X1T224_9MYCO|nr:hypothetical protein AWC01_14780 [Mycolicibacterium doricum]
MPIPETMNYDEMLEKRIEPTRFLQAGGYADRMTVEIRRAGGDEWNLDCIWGVLGHQADGEQQLDVPIKLPASTQLVSSSEVFKAEEAAELFYTYFKTGDIPDNYALRPIGGWTAEGEWVNLSRRPAS